MPSTFAHRRPGIRGRLAAVAMAGALVAGITSPVSAVDLTPPTAGITPDATTTRTGSVTFTVLFSEQVTGLAKGDFSVVLTGVTGCAVNTLTPLTTTSYSVGVDGCVAVTAGTITLRLSSGSVVDLSGNPGPSSPTTSSTVLVDSTAPTVGVPGLSAFLVAPLDSITVTATITDAGSITAAEVSVAGMSWQAMAAADGAFNSSLESATWTGSSPAASFVQQPYSVCVRAFDLAGNVNLTGTCATLTVTDTLAPDVVIAPVSEVRGARPGTHTFAIGFPEWVSGLALGDLRVVDTLGGATGCSLENLQGSSAFYTVDVANCAEGTVAIELLANAVSDAHGHTGPATITSSAVLDQDLTDPELHGTGDALATLVRAGSLSGISVRATDASGIRGVYLTVNDRLPPAAMVLDPGTDFTDVTAAATLGATVDLASGARHTCAALEDGSVRCWGDNRRGQAGVTGETLVGTPRVQAGINAVVGIAAGDAHTCALRRDHTVWCWGDGTFGQSGPGITTRSSTPTRVTGISTAVQVAAGGNATCAVLADGTVRCWGQGTYDQLGDGLGATSWSPVTVLGLAGVTDIAVGPRSACAVESFTVLCWGANWNGEVGDGTAEPRPSPVEVSSLPSAVKVVAGEAFGCALLADATVSCWGDGLYNGILGNGTTTPSYTPVAAAYTDVVDLAAGSDLGVGRDYNGFLCVTTGAAGPAHEIHCAGANSRAQLGRATTTWSATESYANDATPSAAVTAGDGFACSLGTGGDVRCWGDDSLGQAGTGAASLATRVHAARDLYAPSQVAMGPTGACEVIGSRIAKCWGRQEGVPSTYPANLPVIVGTLSTVVSMDVGWNHTCAILVDRVGRCWGGNAFGQLGNNSLAGSTSPVDVAGLVTGTAITVGLFHTCALRADGSVVCWGGNGVGQLGNGTTTSSSTPVMVTGLGINGQLAVDISSQDHTTCAVLDGGTVVCWGDNSYGQLGDGGLESMSSVPVAVAGIKDAVSVAVGDEHACALRAAGTVVCWGRNQAGQLGDGTTTDRPTPVTVLGLTGASDVAAGADTSCAVAGTGVAKCWGGSQPGLRGDGTPGLLPYTATAIPGTDGATALDAAGGSVCATLTTGDLRCWGDNTYGQLAAGTSAVEAGATPRRDGLQLVPDGVVGLVGGLEEGANDVCLEALDMAGRLSIVKCVSITKTSDITPPAAAITAPATPTRLVSVDFLVTFDEAVTGLTAGDLSLTGTAAGCAIGSVTDTGAGWTVHVTGCGEGTVTVHLAVGAVEDAAGNLGPAYPVSSPAIVVDRTAPSAITPSVTLRTGVAVTSATIPLVVSWAASTDPSGITGYQLRSSTDGGSHWTVVLPASTTGRSLTVSAAYGTSVTYCVVATDAAGNQSACLPSSARAVAVTRTPTAGYSGTWFTATGLYLGNSIRYASVHGASATFAVTARAVALVAPKATTRGKVEVWVDGVLASTVDMGAAPSGTMMVFWQKSWSTVATHQIRLVVLGTAGRPRVDFDGFVTLK